MDWIEKREDTKATGADCSARRSCLPLLRLLPPLPPLPVARFAPRSRSCSRRPAFPIQRPQSTPGCGAE